MSHHNVTPLFDDSDEKQKEPSKKASSTKRACPDADVIVCPDAFDIDDFTLKTKRKKKKRKLTPSRHDDEPNLCSICLEPLNSSGYHQICSLKCGHIFGRKCIEKTVKKNGLCPICKNKASVAHIRSLFNTRVSVRDTGDRDYWVCLSLWLCSLRAPHALDVQVNKHRDTVTRLNKTLYQIDCMQTKIGKLRNQNRNLQETNKTLKAGTTRSLSVSLLGVDRQLSIHPSELVKMKGKYELEKEQRIELMAECQFQQEQVLEAQGSKDKAKTPQEGAQQPRNYRTLPWDMFKFNDGDDSNSNSNVKDSEQRRSEHQAILIADRVGIPLQTSLLKKIACSGSGVLAFSNNADRVFLSNSNPPHFDIRIECLMRRTGVMGAIKRCHVQRINDIRCCPGASQQQLLSVSSDKTIAVSDLRTQSKQLFVPLPSAGRSCLWSTGRVYVFAGCDDGTLCVLDLRMNRNRQSHCKRLNGATRPIHSLATRNDEIVVSSDQHCFVAKEQDLMSARNTSFAPFISEGNARIASCGYNAQCDSIVLS